MLEMLPTDPHSSSLWIVSHHYGHVMMVWGKGGIQLGKCYVEWNPAGIPT